MTVRNNNTLPEITSRIDELDKCVNCGLCQAVCPTYLLDGHEGLTARGKITLMKGLIYGDVPRTASISLLFDNCLSCYACQTVCPAGVETQKLWIAARQDLAVSTLRGRMKRLVLTVIPGYPVLFNFIVRLIGRYKGFDASLEYEGRVGALPIFKGAPMLDSLEEEYAAFGDEIGDVAILLGCSCNFSTPGVAEATIKVIRSAGYRVIIPKDQVCCGAPAINNGDWKTARKLARCNIELFMKLGTDWIVSPDATCSGALGYDYQELFLSDPLLSGMASELSEKVVDLGSFISNAIDQGRLKLNDFRVRVTMHDSCHVTHTVGGSRWRAVLSNVGDLELVEMEQSDHCCGFGGSYSLSYRESSSAIAQRKLKNAMDTKADQVLVGSPGCKLHLRRALLQSEAESPRIRHVVELIAETIAEPDTVNLDTAL